MTTSTPTPEDAAAPAVVAVVVSRDPGDWFEESLRSIATQEYPDLSLLVIDAGSAVPLADRVASVDPDAFVHRVTGDPGFSAAANLASELVSGNDFFLFCHDDVRLDAGCVSALVEEVFRSNAAIVGPKLVSWGDPRRLTQLGMGADRFGVLVDRVQRGEFDQQQYDAVRDVFVAPGGVQLIRRDLFDELGGFDPAITALGEDLDICWRAQALGARVLVVPNARAAHLEALGERGITERRALQTRHRLRSMLVATHGRALAVTLPLAVLLVLLEALYAVLAGRRGHASDVLGALGWNLTRWRETSARRAALTERRRADVAEVRALQSGGSARITGFIQDRIDARQERLASLVGSVRASFGGGEAAALRDATVLGLFTFLLVGASVRGLWTGGVEPFGRIPELRGGFALIREWWSGWRSIGLGGPEASPPGQLVLGVLRFAVGWTGGLGDTLVLLAPVFAAPVVAYRAARPIGSQRAAMVAAFATAANPLVPALVAAGQWDALVLHAAAPALLASIFLVEGVAPYGDHFGNAGPAVLPRPLAGRLVRLGLGVAVVGALVPATLPVVVVAVVAMLAGSVLAARPERAGALVVAVPVVVAICFVLWFPWSAALLSDGGWTWLVGSGSPEAQADSMLDLLRFAPGRFSPSWLGLGTTAAAGVGLVIARGARFDVAARGWSVALAAFVVGWVELRGWSGVALPPIELWLALAGAALALVIAAGVRAAEMDATLDWSLRPQSVLTLVATLAFLAVTITGLRQSLDGRYDVPELSFSEFTQLIVDETTGDVGAARVLWLGAPEVLPVDAVASAAGHSFAVTDGEQRIESRWTPAPLGATSVVGDRLDLAAASDTVRLGRLLAPLGVDAIVVVEQLAPVPYDGPVWPIDPVLAGALERQLDLELVPGTPSFTVYANTASVGPAYSLDRAEEINRVELTDQLDLELGRAGARRLDVLPDAPGVWSPTSEVEAVEGEVAMVIGSTFDENWTAEFGTPEPAFDGVTMVPGPEAETLRYRTPSGRRVVQLLVVALGAIGVLVGRRHDAPSEVRA